MLFGIVKENEKFWYNVEGNKIVLYANTADLGRYKGNPTTDTAEFIVNKTRRKEGNKFSSIFLLLSRYTKRLSRYCYFVSEIW